jgi:hypothetical protein
MGMNSTDAGVAALSARLADDISMPPERDVMPAIGISGAPTITRNAPRREAPG